MLSSSSTDVEVMVTVSIKPSKAIVGVAVYVKLYLLNVLKHQLELNANTVKMITDTVWYMCPISVISNLLSAWKM